jgi:PPM family protein phosphatase
MDQPASIWSNCLDYAILSDVGLRRANNQDACAVVLAGNQTDFEECGHLFMVADGMGAHAAGELASKMATDVIPLVYRKRVGQSPPEAIVSAVLDANQQIHHRGEASLDFRGMGTTATTLLMLPAGVFVAHVGDSRAYRVRGTHLEQLTFDHSLVWEMRAAGQLPESDVPGYISKNIITRSLGPSAAVRVDLEGPYTVQPGDAFLLCSDGLSGQVSDDEIGLVLSCLPPAEAVRALVDLANLRGGPDNITVVVARVLGPQIAQAVGPDHAAHSSSANLQPVHPLLWMIIAVAFLAAAGLFALGHILVSLLGLVCAAAAGVVALWQRYGNASRPFQSDGRRFGRGPYVDCNCAANADLLARLAEIGRQLRDAAVAENWSIDWNHFDGFFLRAAAACKSNNLTLAAGEYLHAITFMMSQLRKQETGRK